MTFLQYNMILGCKLSFALYGNPLWLWYSKQIVYYKGEIVRNPLTLMPISKQADLIRCNSIDKLYLLLVEDPVY